MGQRTYGVERGKVFPASEAGMLMSARRMLVQRPARVVSHLELRGDERVLELGAGPGYFSPTLARQLPGGRLVVADLQREMLAMARNRLRGAGQSNFEAVRVDGMELPFWGGTFDAALLVAVLGEIPDPVECLRELGRVVRGGGVVAISEIRGDDDFNAPKVTVGWAEEAGLRHQGTYGPRWNYTAVFRVAPGSG